LECQARDLIAKEMLVLMTHDNKNHSLKGMKAGKLPIGVPDKEVMTA